MSDKDNDENQNQPMDRYGYNIPDRKTSLSFLPIANDTLFQFMEHHKVFARETQDTAYTHVRWHTHKSAGNCFICDLITLLDTCHDIILAISQLDPKRYTFKSTANGSIRLVKR